MAGGTWIAQNKVQPGAYINFESVPNPGSSVGTRGIMTMPVPMTWGPADTIIYLYSTDLLGGNSLAKIGMTAFDPESLIYREGLSNAYLCKLYRMDTGGTKATGSLGALGVAAKYLGTTGNKISAAVQKNAVDDTLFDIITYFAGVEKARQTVPVTGEGLLNNDWVDFNLPDSQHISEEAGVTLVDGTNGTVSTATWAQYLAAADQEIWHVMAVPDNTPAVKAQIAAYIKNKRENTGRKVQAVLVDYNTANYEGIISVDQGYVNTSGEDVTTTIFTATVAGMTAGANINQSNTFRELTSAVSIIDPIAAEDIDAALMSGKFIIDKRQDGVIVVKQDINTLHSFTPTKDRVFSKNRPLRVLDEIGNQVLVIFEGSYIGKVDSNALGRNVFKAHVISFMNELQDMGAIQNFDATTDIVVGPGQEVDAVVCELWVQPVDSMEKLYMRVYVSGGIV
ncbi:MAG: phage tail sheath family protein [Oscillospiraceae bacterium]